MIDWIKDRFNPCWEAVEQTPVHLVALSTLTGDLSACLGLAVIERSKGGRFRAHLESRGTKTKHSVDYVRNVARNHSFK